MAFFGCIGKPEEEKTVTALLEQLIVTPEPGKTLKKVTINPPVIPKALKVTTNPNKTNYSAGETLNLTGLVVSVEMSDGSTKDVTSECSFSPAAGTVIYENTDSVSVSWISGDITYSTGFAVNVKRVLSSISITSNPSKTTYYKGELLDLTGIVVTAAYNSGATDDVTSSITSSPASGTALTEYGSQSITVSYTENGVTKTATFTVSVSVKIVTWAGGTDEEIANMVAAADAGIINLADYWAVGDERKVTLSSMSATGVGESHAKQTVTMVLMHQGLYKLVDGGTCNFIVGQKNGLAEYGYMNSSNTNSGSWDGCARRTWCNNVYYKAIPSALRSIFKKFKTITAQTYNGSTNKVSEDYFTLAAEKEIFGSRTYSNATEANALTQFDYYKTSANRIKKTGDSGSANIWWERSPNSGYSSRFCDVNSDGSANSYSASTTLLLAPFGCI